MYISVLNKQLIALWLSAILLVLSVAASAHSVEHIDEGAKKHCSLCFHQHQFNNVLPQQDVNVEFIRQQYEPLIVVIPSETPVYSVTCLSRAPPIKL